MASNSEPIFRIEHLSLAYPGRRGQPPAQILTDISVNVERGGALTLVGPSGSGKSSLLRCLNRLEEPTDGVVRFDGRPITALDPRELRRRAALVLQAPVLFEGTVRENLMVHAPAVALDVSESRLRETLREVGLEAALLERDAAMGVMVTWHPDDAVEVHRGTQPAHKYEVFISEVDGLIIEILDRIPLNPKYLVGKVGNIGLCGREALQFRNPHAARWV